MSGWGFVYCMSNPCMPGVLKIGMTNRSPMQRCVELSAATGVPANFVLLCYGEVEDAFEVEKLLHVGFSYCRVSAGREFFRINFEAVQASIQQETDHFCMTDAGNEALFDDIGETFNPQAPFLRLVYSAGGAT